MRKASLGVLTVLMFLLTFSGILAEETYLARIFYQNQDQLSGIDSPVYAYFDGYIVTEARGEQLALTRLQYEILDDQPWSVPYWLVSSLPDEPLQIEEDRALFVDDGIALLKMGEEEAGKLSERGYEVARLYRVPLPPRPMPTPIPEGLLLDPFIQSLVDQVSDSTLTSYLQRLEDFRTRYSYTDSCYAAGQWLYDRFSSLGLNVEFDYYTYGAETWRNVVATLPGAVDSSKIFIICGHFDSISEDPWYNAPGADDNASGTALVLEAARILSQYSFDYTARFICFSGEEQGLIGSHHYAAMAESLGMDIGAVLNFDMVAYCDDSLFDFAVLSDINSRPLLSLLISSADSYTILDPYDPERNSGASDHFWFQQYGYRAIFAIELGRTHGNPYYHTSGDVVATLTIPFQREMTKAGIASLACLIADYPWPPQGVTVADAGTGDALNVDWAPNSEADLAGYLLYYGTSSGEYGPPISVGTGTSWVLTALSEGVRYYVALTARDTLNHESGYSLERSAVPYSIPRPPEGLSAIPLHLAVELDWLPNSEGDLEGYNVYRSLTSGGGYTIINPSIVTDTTYRDTVIPADTIYYYVITATDTLANESAYSEEVDCRPMLFDSGILLVDETRNGNGSQGLPTDEQVDSLYHEIVEGYLYADWENSDGSNPPTLADLASHSTILWHSDDPYSSQFQAATSALRDYLYAGGRLFLVGWRVPWSWGEYYEGDFLYDYLHLSDGDLQSEMDFIGTEGFFGYPTLQVDSNRVLPPFQGKLPNIGIYTPRDAEPIYTFNSASGDTHFQGRPCGVRYLGSDHRVVYFGFPLWPMGEDAVLAGKEALDDLGELVGVEELVGYQMPDARCQMLENYPNPFTHTTTIRYAIPDLRYGIGENPSQIANRTSHITLTVYDLSGRLVRTLVDGPQEAGIHQVVWDGKDGSGRRVAVGVYFYRVSAPNPLEKSGGQGSGPALSGVEVPAATRKLILLR